MGGDVFIPGAASGPIDLKMAKGGRFGQSHFSQSSSRQVAPGKFFDCVIPDLPLPFK
jgi:hypothetical protein